MPGGLVLALFYIRDNSRHLRLCRRSRIIPPPFQHLAPNTRTELFCIVFSYRIQASQYRSLKVANNMSERYYLPGTIDWVVNTVILYVPCTSLILRRTVVNRSIIITSLNSASQNRPERLGMVFTVSVSRVGGPGLVLVFFFVRFWPRLFDYSIHD